MTTDAQRVRSPADFLRLAVTAVALVVILLLEWLFGDTLVAFASDLLRGLDALPSWLLTSIVVGTRALTVVVLVGGLAWTAIRQPAAIITMALGGAIAAVLIALLSQLVDDSSGAAVVAPNSDLGALTSGWFPTAIGIGVLAAALTAGTHGGAVDGGRPAGSP